MRLHALLFTDIVDSTRLVERLGDAAAAALWTEHDRRARQLLPEKGQEIDRSDGLFLLFDDVRAAARYAIAYQHAMAELGLSARVGLHAGPVTLRENDPAAVARGAKPTEVEGLAKPLAARILALARGGQTLLSAAARQALGDELPAGAGSRSHGHYRLKGVEEPIEVFELGTAASAYTPPADVDKAYRVVRDGDLWLPLREVRHNLVPERDAFVGRGAELRALSQRLDAGVRLLTLLGSGGTGKTRLAHRYGLGWLGDWPGGVYFCDLSESSSLEGIHFAVAYALGVSLDKGDPIVQLGHAIAGRGRCLIILDNFEQLLAHAGATVGRWLDRTAAATFVVTSRERLHLAGEELFVVEPLPVATEAVELFAARAQAVGPGFALSDSNRAAVAEVVRLLDGLPLAIELAAARVRVLSPAQIVERLKDRFKLLAGARGTAARQATLKAAIDWSWNLMTGWEQAALAQCSVFEGGFTLEAAEATLDLSRWPEAPRALDVVQALVDKSLLRCWHLVEASRYDIDEPHFGMYLSIHEYAADKLQQSAAEATLQAQQRHGRHFAGCGSDAAIEALFGRDGVKRRLALAQEIDNLMAACRRAAAREDADVATPTYCAAWELLVSRGPMTPGVELGAAVLDLRTLSVAQRVDVSLRRAEALGRVGQLVDARAQLEQALAWAQGAADRRREGLARARLGQIDRERGRMADAREHLEAALSILRETGDRIGQGNVLHNLGNLLDQLGIPEHSRACHEAALSLYTEDGNQRGIGQVRASLGILNRHQGRMSEALQEYEAALAILREDGDRRCEGIVLGNMANALEDLGREDEAQQCQQEALAIHRQVGSRIAEAYVLANLALGHERRGERAQARTLLEQVLAIDREVKNLIHEGVTLTQLAALDIAEGRFESGRATLDDALQRHRTLGNRIYIGAALKLLGDLLLRQSRPQEALEPLREGEAVLRAIDNPVELAELLCVKGQAALACGDAASARSALQESESIATRLSNSPGTRLAPAIAALRAAIG
ncbi:MAG: tetratricopeptide repeat protein [Caldimonas sp.]